MEEALEAILGQRSAHSLATGPVMADLQRNTSLPGVRVNMDYYGNLPLHLSLVIDNHAGVVLEVEKLAIFSSEGFPLPDHHSGHDFFPQLWFTLGNQSS